MNAGKVSGAHYDDLLGQLNRLILAHRRGDLGGETMPEDALDGADVPPAALLNVLTLPMALNYQRNSYALWRAVRNALDDPDAWWVFAPALAMDAQPEEVREVLIRHRIALQPNRHPDLWRRVAAGIVASSATQDALGMIDAAGRDVAIIRDMVRGSRRREFPYLSGPKIFNYWFYVLETYGGVIWQRRELISVAPDTHILQASVKLNVVAETALDGTGSSRDQTADAWRIALEGTGLAPIDVHTPLWLWSRMGFPPLPDSGSR